MKDRQIKKLLRKLVNGFSRITWRERLVRHEEKVRVTYKYPGAWS